MATFSPEVGVRLLQDLTSNDEKYVLNSQDSLSYSIVWCLIRLLETEDEEKIEEGIHIVLNYFHISPKIFQVTFLQQVYVAARFSLTALLCSHAICLGIPFPSHLLVESTFRMTYKSIISQHLMGVGLNSTYNLGITSTGEVSESRLIPLSNKIKKISMSTHHSLFLTEDGSVLGCGKGNMGQLGSKLKCLVVEPTLVLQATKNVSIVDILAGEGFSVLMTNDNKINLLGKFGKTGTESGEPLKVQCEKKPLLGMTFENENIIVRLRDWMYTCTLKEEGFSKQLQYYDLDPKAGLETTTVQEVDLKPLYGSENNYHVTLKHILTRIETHNIERNTSEKHVNVPLGMIKAEVRNQPQETMVIYSVHGLILDLNVSQIQVAKNGKVALVASTFSMDKKNTRPRSSCLYTGRAVLIHEDSAAGFEVVRDLKNVSNYRVLFELEEFPCTHSVRLFGMSPDGANLIYLVDRDKDQVFLEERKYHKMREMKNNEARVGRRILVSIEIPKNQKAVTNLEDLNQRREEIGMEPIGLDVWFPDSVKYSKYEIGDCSPKGRLDFVRAIYPAVDDHVAENENGLRCFHVSKTSFSNGQQNLSSFLVLNLLSGQDILPAEAIPSIYDFMMETGYKKTKWESTLDLAERKRIFHEFLDSSLAEVGMKTVELLPSKYLLRSLAAENWPNQIVGDVTIKSSDGETLPFLWDILLFQSEYFTAVMSHGSGDNSIKIDFPMEIVSSALRVFLEPNHLYDLYFEKLFVLIDLYDKYLCYAAIEDTLDVIFETVTEANIHLVYDLYERMSHLQPYLEQQFFQRAHIIFYWKCARIPFGLLTGMNKKIRADEVPQVRKVEGIAGRYHQLMVGADFVNVCSSFLQDAHGIIMPYNWARIRSTEVEKYLNGHWWTTNPKQTELQKSFELQYKAAARFLTEDEYVTPINTNRDKFKLMPQNVERLLDDKKWMKVKMDKESKKTTRVRTTSYMSEQVASPPKSKGLSPLVPTPSSVVPQLPIALADTHEEETTPKEEIVTPVSVSSEASNDQNVDPEFPGVSLKETPKAPKEKLIFPKKNHGVKIDLFSAKTTSPAPWAAASPSPSSAKNFKEIQEEEAEKEKNTPKSSRPVPIVTRRERKNTWQEEVSGSASTPPISLKTIMAEELKRLRPQVKPAKPLEAVAMEERAIQQLIQQYTAEFDGQAVISVTFASPS